MSHRDPWIIRRKVRNMFVTPKSDSKRRVHQPGQKKGMRPAMILEVSFYRTTRPGSKGVCSLPRDMASEMTASRNSQELPHTVMWQGDPCSYNCPKGPRRSIPTPAEIRIKPLPVVTERSYKGSGSIWACKRAVPSSALPVLFLGAGVR